MSMRRWSSGRRGRIAEGELFPPEGLTRVEYLDRFALLFRGVAAAEAATDANRGVATEGVEEEEAGEATTSPSQLRCAAVSAASAAAAARGGGRGGGGGRRSVRVGGGCPAACQVQGGCGLSEEAATPSDE